MPAVRVTTLYDLEGGTITALYGLADCDFWAATAEEYAALHGCDPDEISIEETEEGDFIAAAGRRVGFTATHYRRPR